MIAVRKSEVRNPFVKRLSVGATLGFFKTLPPRRIFSRRSSRSAPLNICRICSEVRSEALRCRPPPRETILHAIQASGLRRSTSPLEYFPVHQICCLHIQGAQ